MSPWWHQGTTLHPISTNHQFSESVRKTGTKSTSENTIASQTSLYYRRSTRIMVQYKKLGLMLANRQMMFGILTHRYNVLKMNLKSSWAMFMSAWTYGDMWKFHFLTNSIFHINLFWMAPNIVYFRWWEEVYVHHTRNLSSRDHEAYAI